MLLRGVSISTAGPQLVLLSGEVGQPFWRKYVPRGGLWEFLSSPYFPFNFSDSHLQWKI